MIHLSVFRAQSDLKKEPQYVNFVLYYNQGE